MYNAKNPLGFIPKRNPKAASPRVIRKANIGEPSTRLPPAPEAREILDEEMAERERIAQLEVERKKLCTAPAYNKGSYTYVYSEDQAKMVGK